eukprot:GHVO01034769.1.p1 GENE.GHVO01034769.1~~GHVO01034769.1.p1  ORF type:complete len:316 (+),score=36.78 GHVO01034769.1:110-949(+)
MAKPNAVYYPMCLRAAFAVRYISTAKLEGLFTSLLSIGSIGGHLDALCLTGIFGSGSLKQIASPTLHFDYLCRTSYHLIDVITRRYLVLTSDFMTTTVAACRCASLDGLPSSFVIAQDHCIKTLNEMGDTRILPALNGIARRSDMAALVGRESEFTAVPRSDVLLCYYCMHPIFGTSDRHVSNSNTHGTTTLGYHCRNTQCRKPLPNCAICFSPITILSGGKETSTDRVGARLPFSQWFTWCVSCHHGGCQQHISEWFSMYDECPVSGCSCVCGQANRL